MKLSGALSVFSLMLFGVAVALPFSLLLWLPLCAAAEPSCNSLRTESPEKTALGSASTWANLRSADGSIKKEIKTLLDEAEKNRNAARPPADFCPAECEPVKQPRIVFRSIPNQFLPDYSDKEECEKLFEQTKAAPFVYDKLTFATLDDLNSWFGDFSQGKGKEGGDLYSRCPGSCSPQYSNIIERRGPEYRMSSSVRCGPARDKSDNQYKLTVAYLWTCRAKAPPVE